VPHGFANAVVWLATTGVAIAAKAASTWSPLPKLAHVRRARSGVVKTWRFGDEAHNARVSTSKLNDARDLCIFTTGDPRDGPWVMARVAFSKIGGTRTAGHQRFGKYPT